MAEEQFDPLGLFAELNRQKVTYLLIGALARVIQGADELTHGVDITLPLGEENLRRLELALEGLNARPRDHRRTGLQERLERGDEVIPFQTDKGELKLVPLPAGTQGYDDLRRRMSREYLGHGVRVAIPSIDDLSRMVGAMGRDQDIERLLAMRRLAELERSLGHGLEL